MNTQSRTVVFNIIAIIIIVAGAIGFKEYSVPANVKQFAEQLAALVVAIINLWLRTRPLPPEHEGFR